jgi:FkbM family methyltransferase
MVRSYIKRTGSEYLLELSENISVWEHLKNAQKPIVLYGMGNGADKILDVCTDKNIKVAGIFASDDFCRSHMFRGYPVTNYAQAKNSFGNMIVLVAFGTGRPEVIRNIERIAGEQELYAPDVPLMGTELFDLKYFHENREKLEQVFEFLEDNLSQKTFICSLDYKISGKIKYLKDCEIPAAEAFRDILAPGGGEVYFDGGAYTGDTVLEFVQSVKGYRKIIAVEPDIKNYRRLVGNTQGMKSIECLHLGLHSAKDEIPFASRAGRNSSFDEGGSVTVAADSIDNILGGNEATLIKLDVEGQEAEALLGAEKTIARYKPKIIAAAYHRSRDLFAIPLLVKKVRPDYRVYIRHFPGIPAWDTFYYFV